ncbi:hypothetical protein [Stenotrophomonas maltophilia]|uniref:hypothetical protein n=1 Tax=Stenotrophomonas maltophilia TaxID=40324 RepID=UPI0021B14753|nr:hypothetical protein [Stenotrophomonas maltophilia]
MKPRNEYVRRLDVLLDRGVVPEELANTEAAAKNLRREHASRCHQRLGRGKWRGGVQSDPALPVLRVRASYPVSPWLWRESPPDHVVQEDIVLAESLQMRSAPLFDAVVVTGELLGKGVTCKVRKDGEAGQLFARQVSSPLINVAAAGAERGRNILSERGEQAAVDLAMPLFPKPLKPGEVGPVMPLDLVEVVGPAGRWHGQCESLRVDVVIDQQAVVIEQTVTLERHYSDAD